MHATPHLTTHPPTHPGVALVEAAVELGRGGEEAVEVCLHAPRVLGLVRQLVEEEVDGLSVFGVCVCMCVLLGWGGWLHSDDDQTYMHFKYENHRSATERTHAPWCISIQERTRVGASPPFSGVQHSCQSASALSK